MDFMFDRTSEGRTIKYLSLADDVMHEAGRYCAGTEHRWVDAMRILDQLSIKRGLPQVIRTDNSKEFCGRGCSPGRTSADCAAPD